MPDFTFLHAADLHLDSPLRGLDETAPAERMRGATRAALINLVDLALRHGVAFVLLAGDLYDGDWKDWRTGHFLVEQLGRLQRVGIQVVAISGNHDSDQGLTRRLPFPGRMLSSKQPETVVLDAIQVAIHGQSFATRAVTHNLARAYPAPLPGHFNIGLLHTACGSTEHDNYAPCTEAQLAAHGYDYWALGHVHTRREITMSRCRIIFPGNPQGRHIREPDARGVTLVQVQASHIASVTHQPVDILRWRHLVMTAFGAEDLDTILIRLRPLLDQALLEAEGRLLAVRITLTGATAAHDQLARDRAEVREQCRGLAAHLAGRDELWIEDVRVETTPLAAEAPSGAHAGAVGALLSALEGPAALDGATEELAKHFARTIDLLEPDHPAREIVELGRLPESLSARARDLLLAELRRG